MIDYEATFDNVTSTVLKVLKNDFHRKDSTLEYYLLKWDKLKLFMESKKIIHLSPNVCDEFLLLIHDYSTDLNSLRETDRRFITSILLLKNYLTTGIVLTKKLKIELNGKIGDLMTQYLSFRSNERLTKQTIHNHKQTLCRFLDFLTSMTVTEIVQIEVKHIFKFFNSICGKYKSAVSTSIPVLRNFFRYLYTNEIIEKDLAAFIPRDNYKRQPQLPSAYNPEEIKKVISSIDRSTAAGKRNYPIILLAAMVGLRASDIANLKFENISWEHSAIRLIQYKTSRELELPLLPEIGNAIIEYLRYGRPKSQLPYIFLLANSPYSKMSQSVVTQIAKKYFIAAGINIENKHHGAHALRHSLATLLLSENIKLPVISEVLGHKNTESTSYYLRIDIQSLIKCALDVPAVCENFYTQKGGYFYE